MKTKTFRDWKTSELEKTFGLTEVYQHPILQEWINITDKNKDNINDIERNILQHLHTLLIQKITIWNEEELKAHFISPLLSLAVYFTPHYQPFLERQLKTTVQGISLSGRVDYVLANGKFHPETPYFCLHEYKREEHKDTDTRGQLLSTLLAIQTLNAEAGIQRPVYGVYVVGRFWFLVVLVDKEYSVSLAYDVTKKDLYELLAVLKYLKVILEKLITTQTS